MGSAYLLSFLQIRINRKTSFNKPKIVICNLDCLFLFLLNGFWD